MRTRPRLRTRTAWLTIFLASLFLAAHPTWAWPGSQGDSHVALANVNTGVGSSDAIAQYKLAYSLLNEPHGDPASALPFLRSAASQNFAPAQFLLGYLYEHGHGVPVDYVRAAENYRAAAAQGHAAAENNLGGLYQYGRGVPRELTQALEWYRASAQHGNPAGQYNLGSFYYLGYGTPRDLAQALQWFRASGEQGFAAAQANLALFYFKGLGVGVNFSEAAHWSRLAAEQGLPHAATNYAYLCEEGWGIPQDYLAAYLWYSRAIAGGDKSSSKRLKSVAHHLTHQQIKEIDSRVAADAARLKQQTTSAANQDPSLTEAP